MKLPRSLPSETVEKISDFPWHTRDYRSPSHRPVRDTAVPFILLVVSSVYHLLAVRFIWALQCCDDFICKTSPLRKWHLNFS